MKHLKSAQPTASKDKKEAYRLNKIPTTTLLSLAAATLGSALAIKMLKKGELAILVTLMALPVSLFYLNKNGAKCCKY